MAPVIGAIPQQINGWIKLTHVELSIKGHTSCNMLSILYKSTLQKELQNVVTNDVFLQKSKDKTTIKKQHKTLAGAGNLTRNLSHPKRMCYHCTTESTDIIDCRQTI